MLSCNGKTLTDSGVLSGGIGYSLVIFSNKNPDRAKDAPMGKTSERTFHYRPQTKLRKGNVFTSVCHVFCVPPRQTRQTPPPTPDHTPPPQTTNAADGTHPTGMHSCFFFICWKRSTLPHLSSHNGDISLLLCVDSIALII